MAAITDPNAIRFVNEEVRPLCEQVRALKARIDSTMTTWFLGVNNVIGDSVQDDIDDGREAEGVSRLTADDVTGAVTVLEGLRSTLNTAGYANRISKPCVRPISVS